MPFFFPFLGTKSILIGVQRRLVVLILLSAVLSWTATLGTFRGVIVSRLKQDPGKRWIYLKAAKGPVRRVEISRAKIAYASEIGKANRANKPLDDLNEGAQVRVTATQDDSGEWQAVSVEILSLPIR